ncbi:hypothetical protein K435DRAFT_180969 [Dendrothele bispora CBS 962.96]|uniref:Uncharacterized protein n=1 Tax=Dendrothele bispora (strain CBS 962.96) TaxID=1314807 RepID=A0A4S8LWB8_DENBC|nr:hypothetical protein K435DRAFT_180969 [Dendrothele bispora CBS 962.96]
MRCPLCRKLFSFDGLHRLRVDQPEDPDGRKKKYSLMRKLVLTCDSEEEDVVAVRKEVNAWLESRTVGEEEHCPLRKTVEILDRLQHGKDRRRRAKREIKHLKESVAAWKSFAQQSAIQRETQSSAQEQKLRELVTRYQQEAEQLRAELELRQKFDDLHVSAVASSEKKKLRRKHSNPLPIPPRVAPIYSNNPQAARSSPDQHHFAVTNTNTSPDVKRRPSLNKMSSNKNEVEPVIPMVGKVQHHHHHSSMKRVLPPVPSPPPPSTLQVGSTTAIYNHGPSDDFVDADYYNHHRHQDAGARRPYDSSTLGRRFSRIASHTIGLSNQGRPGELGRNRDVFSIFTSEDDAAYFTCPSGTRSLWMDEMDEAALSRGVAGHYGIIDG